MRAVRTTLRIGELLDRRFALLRGEMERSKDRTLLALARILEEERVPYALIGGVAVQIWSEDPRTTLDIDLAVSSYDDLPRSLLERDGFSRVGRFAHSENWKGPDGTPVPFTDDPMLLDAIRHAESTCSPTRAPEHRTWGTPMTTAVTRISSRLLALLVIVGFGCILAACGDEHEDHRDHPPASGDGK